MSILICDKKTRRLYSDSRLTMSDTIISDKCKKIYRVDRDRILGFVGDYAKGIQLLKALKGDMTLPNVDKDVHFTAMMLHRDGKLETYYHPVSEFVDFYTDDRFVVDGSGYQIVMGAMYFTDNPYFMIKAAIKYDTGCGGNVQSMGFDDEDQ